MNKADGKEIWFTTTKTGTRRAWCTVRQSLRAFPLPLKDAELAIMTGMSTETTKPEWLGR